MDEVIFHRRANATRLDIRHATTIRRPTMTALPGRLTRLYLTAALRLGGSLRPGGMRGMIRLAPLAVIVLALVGCDPVVQARYQPTTVDEVFGVHSKVIGVAAEVHELPSSPPAIDQTGLSKRPNRKPGVVQKPTDMVGVRDSRRHVSTVEATLQAGWHEPPMSSPATGPAHRIAGFSFRQEEVGAKESITTPIERSTLQPGRSLHRNEPTLMGTYRRDVYSYHNEDANLR